MDEHEEVGDNLDVPRTDEEAPKGVAFGSGDWMEGECSLAKITETVVKEANIGTGEINIAEGLGVGDLAYEPTGQVSEKGDVATQGVATGADVEDEGEFNPDRFWLLLEQASYEIW